MKNKQSKTTYCPMERDIVEVIPDCALCRYWDGKVCRFLDATIGRRGKIRMPRSAKRMIERLNRRLSHKRGGRLKETAIKEKWPHTNVSESQNVQENEYGTDGLIEQNELSERPEKKDEYILPELIKEYWDVVADMPDWISGLNSNMTPIPGSPQSLLPEGTNPELLPPSTGPGTEMGSRPDDTPGLPPAPFNEPIP